MSAFSSSSTLDGSVALSLTSPGRPAAVALDDFYEVERTVAAARSLGAARVALQFPDSLLRG